jgi:hypothetical protein
MCRWELWKTVLPFSTAVGAFFSVHGGGSFHGRWSVRLTKVTGDIGRFDDESR